MSEWGSIQENAFTHRPVDGAVGERCRVCVAPATHKVEEVTDAPRHPFTAYVCCAHFDFVMGSLAQDWCTGAWPTCPPTAAAPAAG